mgnify:CR=1 FL=1
MMFVVFLAVGIYFLSLGIKGAIKFFKGDK